MMNAFDAAGTVRFCATDLLTLKRLELFFREYGHYDHYSTYLSEDSIETKGFSEFGWSDSLQMTFRFRGAGDATYHRCLMDFVDYWNMQLYTVDIPPLLTSLIRALIGSQWRIELYYADKDDFSENLYRNFIVIDHGKGDEDITIERDDVRWYDYTLPNIIMLLQPDIDELTFFIEDEIVDAIIPKQMEAVIEDPKKLAKVMNYLDVEAMLKDFKKMGGAWDMIANAIKEIEKKGDKKDD